MNRRSFLRSTLTAFFASLSFGIVGRALASSAAPGPITRIAFGSCLYQTEEQPIWKGVHAAKPQLFAFLGDTIYADTEDMAKMKKDYAILDAVSDFARLRKKIPVIGTWDDHDYGKNDGGAEYAMKKQSKELMMDFYREPRDSERRKRDGVYTSYFYGEAPCRLQVILLDLRTFRTPLKTRTADLWGYDGDTSPGATLLGQAQWAWLEDQLRQPADLRILCSSVQFASSEHEWEKWANFPREKERLVTLIDRLGLRNLVVLSGDMHFAELSKETTPSGIELFDLTASGLNVIEKVNVLNSKRLHHKDNFAHFGFVQIDWKKRLVRLEIRDEKNKVAFGKNVRFIG